MMITIVCAGDELAESISECYSLLIKCSCYWYYYPSIVSTNDCNSVFDKKKAREYHNRLLRYNLEDGEDVDMMIGDCEWNF